jgi:DNA-damage-inducible protein J
MDSDLKQAAEAIFSQLGVSPSEAIRIFYKQVALHQGFPFDLRLPNAATIAALQELNHPERLIRYERVDDMFAAWNADEGEC